MTLATSVHLVVYPRRRGLIFLSYIASLKPELHDNVNRPTVFFRSGCSRSIFSPRRPIDFLTLQEKEIVSFGSGDGVIWAFFHCYILFEGIYTFCVCVCVWVAVNRLEGLVFSFVWGPGLGFLLSFLWFLYWLFHVIWFLSKSHLPNAMITSKIYLK